MNHPITPLTGNWGSLTPDHNQIKLTPICTIPTFSDSEAMLISLKSSRMGWWVIYLLMARQTRPAVKKKVNRKPLRYISDPFCGRGSLPGFNDYNVFKEPFFSVKWITHLYLDCKMQLIYILLHRVGVFKTRLIHLCMFGNLARRKEVHCVIMNDAQTTLIVVSWWSVYMENKMWMKIWKLQYICRQSPDFRHVLPSHQFSRKSSK